MNNAHSQLKTHLIIQSVRTAHLLLHILLGVTTVLFLFPLVSTRARARLIRWWCKHLLCVFNIQLAIFGKNLLNAHHQNGAMLIANHISWLDIHALNSVTPLRFIAKSEIKDWPIFGYLVKSANTLFIDRNKKQDAKRTIDIATASLRAGDYLGLFPEGTTTEGQTVKPFKSSLIEAALLASTPIYPVAIRYPNPDGSANIEMAYAGDTTMMQSMRQILAQPSAKVELHFLPLIDPEVYANMDRRTLTLQIEHTIRHQLTLNVST